MTNLTRNAFTEERQPGDLDLVAEITTLLQNAGHPNPTGWHSAPEIQEAMNAAPKLQRFLISTRHYRLKLAGLEKDTTTERFVLGSIDTTDKAYLEMFNKGVVPTLVKYGL